MNTRDALDALPDALAERWGNKPRLAHPLAQDLLETPLSRVALACGEATYVARGGRPSHVKDIAVMGLGMGSSDFKNAISNAARKLAVARYDAFAEHLLLCADQEVRNFHPVDFPGADVDLNLEVVEERMPRKQMRFVDVAGQTGQLATYAREILISREVIVNDDVQMLGGTFGAIGAAAARIEAQMVANLLEANLTLADGQPMFGSENIVASALNATSLDAAMAALRTQTTPAGNLANHRAHVLTVAAGLELSARTLLHSAGLDLPVVCLPWLAAGRWYLQASPTIAPVVGRLLLAGNPTGRSIIVGSGKTPPNVDGFVLAAAADLGVVALGRVGIVRGGA